MTDDDFLSHLEGLDSMGNPDLLADQDVLADPEGVIIAGGEQWAATARQYVKNAPWPGKDASPWDVKDALVEVRAALDRVESMLSSVIGLRYSTAAKARKLEQAADDAWDERAGAERRAARREFTSAKELHAYWNLDIKAQRQAARKARELADYVQALYDRVRLAHDSLNTKRRDLDARLTHLRWESNQEQ